MKLKSRMTVGEMSEHLTEHTGKFANRVSVGRYAKKLGYAVYKPMINGRICQFYVNPSIKGKHSINSPFHSKNVILLL